MDHEALFPIKIMAILGVAGMLALGGWMLKNEHRLFGFDPEVPSDGTSPRTYGKVHIWLTWLLMLKVFGFFAYSL
ncbi:MAG TPA: hypothetical protein VD994_02075 [Prosthecobacter sp.]|nr:hypothetical protein [Prosthecobacter sp.]